jgi:hypothetical protein
MIKEIVLLTKSKKIGNYCISGVDTETGEWVRIISEDNNIQNAVRASDIKYQDGTMPDIMDIVRIKCKGANPTIHQPENYVMDNGYYWGKKGSMSMKELLKIHPIENKSFLFYDADKSIDASILNTIKEKDRYSLIMINPKDIRVHVNQWPEGKKVTMSFIYSNRQYRYMRITDTEFENEYKDKPAGNYILGQKHFLVISLGDQYTDGKHYKLIAKVLPG